MDYELASEQYRDESTALEQYYTLSTKEDMLQYRKGFFTALEDKAVDKSQKDHPAFIDGFCDGVMHNLNGGDNSFDERLPF